MKLNNILKYLLILLVFGLFVSLAVIAIIISRGGIITKDGIIETGVIRMQIQPDVEDLQVFLDNKPITLQNNRIGSLPLGTYNVRIESEKYATWEKDIKVFPGVVVDIHVRLYPVAGSLEQITNTNIDAVAFSDSGEFIFYVVTKSDIAGNNGLWRLKFSDGQFFFNDKSVENTKIIDLVEPLKSILTANNYVIKASPDSQKLLIIDSVNNDLLLLNTNNTQFNNLETTLGYTPSAVDWFTNDSLILSNDGIVYEYNLKSSEQTLIYYSPGHDFKYVVSENRVYLLNQQSRELLVYESKISSQFVLPGVIALPVDNFFVPKGNAKTILVRSGSEFWYFDLDKRLKLALSMPVGAQEIQVLEMASDGRTILFNIDGALYSYLINPVPGSPDLSAELRKLATPTEPGLLIKFIPQATHFLYFVPSTNEIMISDRDGTNLVTLLSEVENIKLDEFNVWAKGSSFVILLQDENETTTSLSGANLYQIDLE